jgi:two-component system, sensor histidine kinase ChiS
MIRRHDIDLLRRAGLAALLLVLFAAVGCTPQKTPPQAAKGQLDLSAWNFVERGPVRLFGEWAFHWQQLLEPKDLSAVKHKSAQNLLHVPGLWQEQTIQGVPLTAMGYGTYHLRIQLPSASTTPLSLFVSGALSVCKIWINDAPVAASGIPWKEKALEKPEHHFILTDFEPHGDIVDIIIQVSNYHNTQGGFKGDICLGTEGQIHRMLNIRWISGAFMAGALLCMSLYHFVLFSMRRTARYNLYFGLFCLLWCITTIFSPVCGFLIDMLCPSFPWIWYIDLSILPYGLTIPLMLLFYHSLFPKKYGDTVDIFYFVLGTLFIVYVLIPPAKAYDPVLFAYFILTRTAFLYLFYGFILDILHKEDSVLLLAPGYLALGYAEFDNILFKRNIVSSADFGPYGVFLFILAYSFFISARFARAFSSVEKLSTELEVTNNHLMRLGRLKDAFLANTTHELKTPLAGMVGIAETLLAGAGGKLENAAKEHLRVLAHSGKRLSNLVNDVLDLSRLKHQDVTLRKGLVNLQGTVQRVLAVSEQLAAAKKLTLQCEIPPDFPNLWADQDRLEQILFNLVGNSLKFTGTGGIVIAAAIRGERAEIAVTDTGIGISQEDQERIFKAHEQLEAAQALAPGGTGLGLAITRQLVELHGGVIQVRSQPGHGSTFTFTLPLHDACNAKQAELSPCSPEPPLRAEDAAQGFHLEAPLALPAPVQSDRGVPGGQYRVLVVDDEPVNRHVIASCLQLADITFRTAGDGKSALRMLEDGDRPDMLLLDVMMPVLSGYAVCRELRKKHPASALPVIMLTVKSRTEDIVEGFAAGANDYLTKPFSRDELVARVRTQLKLKEAYHVLEENLALRTELDLRQKTEQSLRLTQLRLSRMLDSLDDAILAVNQSREINFCNRAFAELAGYSVDNLLGHPLALLLQEPQSLEVQALMDAVSEAATSNSQPCLFERIQLALCDGKSIPMDFYTTGIELEDEPLLLLIVRPPGAQDGPRTALASAAMLRELGNNRQRILNLEATMLSLESGNLTGQQVVLDDLKALDTLLEHLGSLLTTQEQGVDRRLLAVRVMHLAVACWEAGTTTSKVELAEQSRIWTVYQEKDGYCRTQTLDKYLSEKTLPARPRWRDIHATAEFVLAHCNQDTPLYEALQDTFADLKRFA